MPNHLPSLAARAAVVATLTTTAAIAAVLPATTAAAPAATHSAAPATSASIPAAFLPPAPVSAPAAAPVTVAVAPVALSTSAAASALKSALAKVGSPYRWGAAGPSAFDCSGLVQWSFSQVGVDLPHSSRTQSTLGTAVDKADLRPGDLVFFYTPVSHVGIYIGGGMVVHASSRRSPVKISSLSGMPFHNARRI